MTITDFTDYMRYERGRSERTIESYRRDLEAFQAYFHSLEADLTFETVDTDIVRDWMEDMMDCGNTATSVCRRLSALKSFYRFALSHGLVSCDPAYAVNGPKKRRPLPQFVREDEMERLLDQVEWGDDYNSVRTRTIIIAFYETGMRLSELIGLDDADVSIDNRELRVMGKGSKQRVIPFGDELAEAISRYKERRNAETPERATHALFTDNRGQRMSAIQVRTAVKRSLSLVCKLKKRSPHVLRHSYATALLDNGADIESVRKLLGHERLSTTEIYTHTSFRQLRDAYRKAHPRD